MAARMDRVPGTGCRRRVGKELGDQLDPSLDRFRRLRLAGRYRLVYTYDSDTDTWWICLIWEHKPGKPEDVYEILKRLAESFESK